MTSIEGRHCEARQGQEEVRESEDQVERREEAQYQEARRQEDGTEKAPSAANERCTASAGTAEVSP